MSEASFTFSITTIEVTAIVIGFIGNIISIIVFSRKTFRNNSIGTYCTALAIVDCLTLIQSINHIDYFMYNQNLMDLNTPFCKFIHTIVVYISAIPPYIMIAFSVDKLLSMRMSSFAILKKKWFQWSIVAGIALFHIGLYMYYPILIKRTEIFPGFFICDITTIGFLTIHMTLVLIDSCLIPFVILTITSILTIRVLMKSSNSIERMGNLSKERKSRDRKYAITSVALNTIFIVLKLPSTIFLLMFASYSYFDVYFYNIGNLLFFLNSSIGFFVFLVTNSLFRREFLVVFRLVKTNNGSSVITTGSLRPIRSNQVSSTM